jgi:hypothetical protein
MRFQVTAAFIFLMFALKIPIAGLLYIVWWAIHQTPEPAGEGEGGTKAEPRPDPHPRNPRNPRPRRGPHAEPAPASPPRVRSVVARGRHAAGR